MRSELTKYIHPTLLENIDSDRKMGNKALPTVDLLYLESSETYCDSDGETIEKTTSATDWALANGAYHDWDSMSSSGKYGTVSIWLRDAFNKKSVSTMNSDHQWSFEHVEDRDATIRPAMRLEIPLVVKERKANSDAFKIDCVKDMENKVMYHTIEFGQYPKTYVGEDLNFEIDWAFWQSVKGSSNANLHGMRSTGNEYLARIDKDGKRVYAKEYQYNGDKYVRIIIDTDYESVWFESGELVQDGSTVWIRVEPIVWRIRNWEDLPKELNPTGNGTATCIEVVSEEGIATLPFYPNCEDKNRTLWANSTIRGYLNGISVNNLPNMVFTQYTAPNGGDFSDGGFLKEAFGDFIRSHELEDTAEDIKEYITNKKSRLDQLNPDDTAESDRRQMTDKELIQSWVDAGRSVLLRGPSGIGKTEKLKELYPDLIYLKLTNNMFPEKVVGSMNLQTGQSIPPDFAKQAILACATDEERALVEKNIQNLYKIADDVYERSKTAEGKVVIMLDELLNVKPAVQSLVYTLVLNKIVENGNGMKLPANTVIVATGNQKKYSSVAEDLAEPLEKRFDHIYDMQPKVGEWIYEYAIPNNIHPSVVSYVLNKYMCQDKSEEISDMGYFYEEPEIGEEKLDIYGCKGRTNDPRGWTSISNMLYSFEDNLTKGKYKGKDVEHILDTSLKSKLREEWAADFMDFYNNPTISVEDVVAGNYAEADLPQDINERFAYVSGLIGADEKQLPKVRDFIRKYCDPEYVELYDITWVGKSEERAEQLAEVKSWQDAEWKEEHAAEKDVIEEKTEEHVGDKKPSEEWYKLQKTIKELGDFLVDNDELYKY